MSTVSYDLDTSGGLMPLIKALIKPPDEEGNGQKSKKPQHPYYKRPGKGHNHDSCDACGEGGDLICCDRCPASFHLGCYDPPLDENDIPAGLWLCRECRASDADNPPSSKGSRAQSPTDSKSDSEKKTRSLRNRSNSKKRSKDSDEEQEEKETKEADKELTPMEVLVRAARIMNPTQFQLPREMQVPCTFPGTEKEGTKNGGPVVVSVDSQGLVPLPARACHVCAQTCKHAALVQCDYCPLLYHQDCLDPPMTALPTGRWMCPNHVENFIDWKLVDSVSLSSRVALWDKFSAPVDQHALKVDFLRRARRGRMLRMRAGVGARGRVQVPEAVRRHYEHPPPLLPSRREYVRCTNVLKKLKQAEVYSESSDEEGPKHEVCLNLDCAGDHASITEVTGHDKQEPQEAHEKDDQDDEMKKEESTAESSELSDSDFEHLSAAVKKRKVGEGRVRVRLHPDAQGLLRDADHQLRWVDPGLVKLLACQRLHQVLWCERYVQSSPLSARAQKVLLRALPPHRRAHCLPSHLLSRADRERISRVVWGPTPPIDEPTGGSLRDVQDELKYVRAALFELKSGSGEAVRRAIPMRRAVLTVGTDSGCDVRLDGALCSRVASRHAVIFMDEVSRQFELINYSEYGSQVNGVLYANDVSATGPDNRDVHIGGDPPPKAHSIFGDLTSGCGGGCSCGRERRPPAAWEGSALVPHAALLSFGCRQYVFAVTHHHCPPEPAL